MAAATHALQPARVLRWVLRWVLWRMLAALLLGWPVAPAAGQTPALSIGPRIALIIANGDYATPKDRLSGPLNDAVMLRDTLQGRGFGGLDGDRGLNVLFNAGQAQMRQKLWAFRDALDKAGPLALGVLYFAGHGGADAAGKDNYILPVDTPDLATTPIELHGIAVRWISSTPLGQIDIERRPTIAIVIDACRTPPGTVAQSSRGTASTRALVMPDDVVPHGMLIALSTGPGQIAYDSGIYAQVLAEKIKASAGVPLPALFDEVKLEVARQSGQAQMQVQQSQLLDKVCLALCRTQPQSDPMVMLRSAIALRAAGDVGQVAVLEQIARDGRSVAGLDLSGQFLAGGRLAGIDAADAKLVLANLQGADLSRARLERSRMLTVNAAQARFDGATLDGSIGAYGLFNRASFVGASLQRVSWEMTDLRDANFNRANLAGADLAFADLRGADFTNADLRGAVLVGADLRGARFDDATFADTDLAVALFDGSLRAQVVAGGICATLVGQVAGNYARVMAATNSGSNRQIFEKSLPLPAHADGQLPACQIRVGRVWERRYTLSPIYRASNSGREFLGLESDFGYDAVLLATANRRDMVISRYRQVAQNLQMRFGEFGNQPPTGGRLRQAQLLAALERSTAVPVAPV